MAASTWSTTDKTASLTLSGSNLIATAAAANQGVRGKDPKRTGKYYLEYTSTTTQNNSNLFGFAAAKAVLGTSVATPSVIAPQAQTGIIICYDAFGVQISALGTIGAITTSSIVCAAIDLDNQLSWFRLGAAGNWNGSATANPATAVGGSSLARVGIGQGIDCFPFLYLAASGPSITANFGGSAFTGTVPSGFTSGWDDSVSALSNMVATQVAIEEWGVGTPAMNVTQIAIEEWATVAAAPAITTQARVMVLA
jgi:hypothetical protein